MAFDAAAFRETLNAFGEERVREMLAEGRYGEEKRAIVEHWLASQATVPIAERPWRGFDPAANYQPTAGDLTYRNAIASNQDINPFEEAFLLKGISHEYLSALLSDNSSPRSASFRAQLDAEVARRGSGLAVRANRIAMASLVVAVLALIAALVGWA